MPFVDFVECGLPTEPIQRKLRVPRQVGAWLSLARAPGSGPGGRWFKSTRPDHFLEVRPGDMGNTMYLRHG